jgi:GcrA cell cycle regulator
MTDFTTRPVATLNTEVGQQSWAPSLRGGVTTRAATGGTTGRAPYPWPESWCILLCRLWRDETLSASQIAPMIDPCLTRNAVIGKARRLMLPRRREGLPGAGRPRTGVIKVRVLGRRPGRPFGSKTMKRRWVPPPLDDFAIPIDQRKTLLELEPHHCRYPVGHPNCEGFFFCGGPIIAEGSYCASHWARCHMEVPRRGR